MSITCKWGISEERKHLFSVKDCYAWKHVSLLNIFKAISKEEKFRVLTDVNIYTVFG